MATTIRQELKERGLDFIPRKTKLYTQIGKKRVLHPGAYSIVRVEGDRIQILGEPVGADYHVVPKAKALGFLDPILGNDSLDAKVIEMMEFKNGAALSVTVELKGARLTPEYTIEKRVTIVTSHDGNRSIHALMVPTVKDGDGNEIRVPMETSEEFRFRHTSGVDNRLDSANRLLGLTDEFFAGLQKEFANMASTPVDPDAGYWVQALDQLLDSVAPAKEKGPGRVDREKARNVLFRHLRTQNPTLLNAFLGLCEYVTKWRRVRKQEALEWGNLTGRGLDTIAKLRKTTQQFILDQEPA